MANLPPSTAKHFYKSNCRDLTLEKIYIDGYRINKDGTVSTPEEIKHEAEKRKWPAKAE